MSRRRRSAESVSQERWLVSYADFITLLFAFFVVLFASAYHDRHAVSRVSHSVHDGFESLGADAGVPRGLQSRLSGQQSAPSPSVKTPAETLARTRGKLSQADLLQLQRELRTAMHDEVANQEITLRLTPDGLVISVRELGFFDSARASLLPGAGGKITRIARILAQHHLELRIEGHSDSQPIHNSEYRSNWELSTARALTVLQIFLDDAGYNPQMVSVAGYGEYRPLASDSTPAGRRLNRRVDLVVLGIADPASAGPAPRDAAAAGKGPTAPWQ